MVFHLGKNNIKPQTTERYALSSHPRNDRHDNDEGDVRNVADNDPLNMSFEEDIEKKSYISDSHYPTLDTFPSTTQSWLHRASSKLSQYGVETHGVSPVPEEKQTYTRFANLFFLWISANTGMITFSTGSLGPIVFGLGIKDSALVILFINALCTLLPAYFSTFGSMTGLRQMIFARYSFGYIGAAIISTVNIVVFMGFLVLNCILGGETLASASSGHLTATVGIVIIALVSLSITFCGYRVMNIYERYAWIPVTTVFIICSGITGKDFQNPAPLVPASASTVLSFAASVAGFVISWACLAADYTIYMPPTVSKGKVFTYAYLGFLIPLVLLEVLGAVFAANMFIYPEWARGYDEHGVGGLLAASLSSVGKFGKFCMVVLALSVPAACAPTMYSFGVSFQCVSPFFAVVPRYIFSIGATAVLIPVAIVGATHFEPALLNFLAVIGYYCAPFSAIVLAEHVIFRRSSPASYDPSTWNSISKLPSGWPGVLAFVSSFGLIVPSMDQVWFVGPFARGGAGDIGFEVGFFTAGLLYTILRFVDIKFVGKRLGGTPS